MTQEKMKRIITACVSAGTVLLVLLLSFLIYQWITIAVLDKRIEEAEKENAKYEQIIQKGNKDLEFYQAELGKDWLAHLQGWFRPSED